MSDVRTLLERASERAAPPVDAFERLSRARRRRQRSRRVGAGFLACTVFAVGATGLFLAFRRSASSPTSPPHGYFVDLPTKAATASDSKVSLIDATTNLPNGTVVQTYFFSAEVEGPGDLIRVMDDHIIVKVTNDSCRELIGVLRGSRFTLTLGIAPTNEPPFFVSHGPDPNPPSPPSIQPAEVLSILGQRFEHLEGNQVTSARGYGQIGGYKHIVVSRSYQLPASTCTAVLVPTSGGSFTRKPVTPPVYPRGAFESCPDVRDALSFGSDARTEAAATAVAFDLALQHRDSTTLARLTDPSVKDPLSISGTPASKAGPSATGGGAALKDGLVNRGCGPDVAKHSWFVIVNDGTNSTSFDTTFYSVKRAEGWKVWGSY